jgi:hypothetical protein
VPAHTARITVISVETRAQCLLLDAYPDAKQEGEDGDHRKSPPRAEHERGTGEVEERAEIHRMTDDGIRARRNDFLAAVFLYFYDGRREAVRAHGPVYEQEGRQEEAASYPLHGRRHYRPAPPRSIRCHEAHSSKYEEQDRYDDQLVR